MALNSNQFLSDLCPLCHPQERVQGLQAAGAECGYPGGRGQLEGFIPQGGGLSGEKHRDRRGWPRGEAHIQVYINCKL